MKPEHSRPLRLASQVSSNNEANLFSTMENTDVVVSVETERPGLVATAAFVLDTLRRLPVRLRLVPSGLSGDMVRNLAHRAAEIDPLRGLILDEAGRADIHLRIGYRIEDADIVASPDRYGVRLTTDTNGSTALGWPPARRWPVERCSSILRRSCHRAWLRTER